MRMPGFSAESSLYSDEMSAYAGNVLKEDNIISVNAAKVPIARQMLENSLLENSLVCHNKAKEIMQKHPECRRYYCAPGSKDPIMTCYADIQQVPPNFKGAYVEEFPTKDPKDIEWGIPKDPGWQAIDTKQDFEYTSGYIFR
jgi:hypothetical protein